MSTTQPNPKSKLMPLSALKISKIKHCYVPGCTTSYSPMDRRKTYFYMPAALSRRRQWMTAIGRPNCRDRGSICICEDHFDLENDAYFCKVTQITVLKTNAVPKFKITEPIEHNRPIEADTGLNSNDSTTVDETVGSDANTSVIDETEHNSVDFSGDLSLAEDKDPLADVVDPLVDAAEMLKSSVTQAINTVNVSPKSQRKRAKLQTYLNVKLTDEQRRRFQRSVGRLRMEPSMFVRNFWLIVRRNSHLRRMRCLINSFSIKKIQQPKASYQIDKFPSMNKKPQIHALLTKKFKRIGFFSRLRRSLVRRETRREIRRQRRSVRPPPTILESIIEIHDEDGSSLAVPSEPERKNIASLNVLDKEPETFVLDKNARVPDGTESSFKSDDDDDDVGEGELVQSDDDDADDAENESVSDVPIISDVTEPKLDSTDTLKPQESITDQTPIMIKTCAVQQDKIVELSPTTHVNKKLREQLNLLQMGKRRKSIFRERPKHVYSRRSDKFRTTSASRSDTPVFSRIPSQSSFDSTSFPETPDKTTNKTVVEMKTPDPTTLVSTVSTTTPPPPSNDGKRNFIDSLINKLNINAPTIGEKGFVATPVQSESPSDDIKDDENSISSDGDFFGFAADDMLTFERSAFVSKKLDRFMIDNALENVANVALPAKKSHDEAMMFAEAKPPTQVCPQRPHHMEKARTVAEKRLQLEQQTDIKVLMIENELTISRELTRRNRTQNNRVNVQILNDVQDSSIPFTRDCWRLTSWLRTENGRFYYQTFRTDLRDQIKIHSGRGNFARKVIYDLPQISRRATRKALCRGHCPAIDHIKINNLEILRPETEIVKYTIPVKNPVSPARPVTPTASRLSEPLTPRRLNVLAEMYRRTACKPAPLSLKLRNSQRTSLDMELGPLQLYKMPSVQLQVWPKLERPLPLEIRPYLKTVISYQCLTAEWAAFAVSTLIEPPKVKRRGRPTSAKKEAEIPIRTGPFTFEIPYCNDQNSVLVRKRKIINNANPAKLYDDPVNEKVFTFAAGIDRTDTVALEVADVLCKMIDSVSISICESAICKIDPDAIVSEKELLDTVAPTTDCGKRKLSSKLMKELKRLNATIIDECVAPVNVNCGKEFCKLGCICDSLTIPKTFGYHCKQIDCLFECCCPSNDIANEFETRGHNRDMQQLRDRATARLAKVEREFTATVVVSKDNTIYIPNKDYTRKRSKRLPKRLDDCVRYNEQPNATNPNKKPDTSEPGPLVNDSSLLEPMEVSPKKTLPTMKKMIEHLRHVSVPVVKLPHLENFEPWCMVHNLYKCFCKLEAIDGEPFKFREEGGTGIEMESDFEGDYAPGPKKRQYTFEKEEQEQLENWLQKKKTKQESSPVEREIFSCARCRHFDTDMQLSRNKKNVKKIRSVVYHEERQRPELQVLLNSRIKHCCMLGSEKMFSIPECTITKPDLPMQTENRTTAEKAKANTDSLLRKTMDLPRSMSPSPPQKLIMPLCKQPVANWNQHLLGNRPMTPKRQRNITHLNYWVNRVMDQVTSHQKKAKTLSPPTQKLTTLQWCHFLDLFNSDAIFVWEVKLENLEVMLAVTIKNVMPSVENAICVINVKVVVPERLPVLAKLLRLGRLPQKTNQLAVLLYGYTNYWKIIGVMNSDVDYLEKGVTVRPTPVSHPLLASKISKVYDLLDSIRAKRDAENSNATELPSPTTSTTPTERPSSTSPIPSSTTPIESPSSPIPSPLTPIPPQPAVVPDEPAQMAKSVSPLLFVPISNIPIVKLTPLDLSKIEVPIPVMGAHRWFMLTVVDDFTHLFIPSWKNYISFIQIQAALKNAAQKRRTVRLSAQASPHIYIAHTYTDKIFFGPYGVDDILDLSLFKKIDGTITRVEMTDTDVEGPKTTGCWLYMKDDVAIVCESHLDDTIRTRKPITNSEEFELRKFKEEPSDDCVIVENESERTGSPVSSDDSQHMPSTLERETTAAVQQLLAHELPSLKNFTPEKLAPLPRIAFVTSQNNATTAMVLSTKSSTTTIPTPPVHTVVAAPSKLTTISTPTILCSPPPRLTTAPSATFIRLSPSSLGYTSMGSVVVRPNTSQSTFMTAANKFNFSALKRTTAPIKISLAPNKVISAAQTTTVSAAPIVITVPPLNTMMKVQQSTLLRATLQQPSKVLPPPLVNLFPYAQYSNQPPPLRPIVRYANHGTLKRSIVTPPHPTQIIKRRALNPTSETSLISEVHQKLPLITINSLPSDVAQTQTVSTADTTKTSTYVASRPGNIGLRRRFTISDIKSMNKPDLANFPKGVTVTLNGTTMHKIFATSSTTAPSLQLSTTTSASIPTKTITTNRIWPKENPCSSTVPVSIPITITTTAITTTKALAPIKMTYAAVVAGEAKPISFGQVANVSTSVQRTFPKITLSLQKIQSKPLASSVMPAKILRRRASLGSLQNNWGQVKILPQETKKAVVKTTAGAMPSLSSFRTAVSGKNETKNSEPVAGPSKAMAPSVTLTLKSNSMETIELDSDDSEFETDVPVKREDSPAPKLPLTLENWAIITAQKVLQSQQKFITAPTYVVRGHLISNVFGLGKIEASQQLDGISMQLCHMQGKCSVNNLVVANEYLDVYVRRYVYAFEPRNLEINWRFVPEYRDDNVVSEYRLQEQSMFTPSTVVLSDRLIDLLSDFDANSELSSDTIGRLRLLRLAHLCINKTEIRNTSDLGIVEKATETIKEIIELEQVNQQKCIANGYKIHMKKRRLRELLEYQKPEPFQTKKKVKTEGNSLLDAHKSNDAVAAEVITIDDDAC